MLTLQISKGDYITINDNIVVQVFPDGGRATLRVDAPREVPVVRGALREREGSPKPEVIAAGESRNYKPKARSVTDQIRRERYFDKVNRWQTRKSEAAAALETMERCLADIKSPEVRRVYREQINKILPLTE